MRVIESYMPILISFSSLILSIIALFINTRDSRVKEEPFFLMESKMYTSSYRNLDIINPIFYNFIFASVNDVKLTNQNLKTFKKEVDIRRNNSYFEIQNVGGISKNLTVSTKVVFPIEKLKLEKPIKLESWEFILEKQEKADVMGEYSLFAKTIDENQMHRIWFDSPITFIRDYKGITTNGKLQIRIPTEFLLHCNLYLTRIIEVEPLLLINVKGKDIFNRSYEEDMEVSIERYKISTNDSVEGLERYVDISFIGR